MTEEELLGVLPLDLMVVAESIGQLSRGWAAGILGKSRASERVVEAERWNPVLIQIFEMGRADGKTRAKAFLHALLATWEAANAYREVGGDKQ